MKKVLSLLFVLILSFSFIACGPNLKGEQVTDEEDITDYFGDRDLSEDSFSYKFSVKYESKDKTLYEEETEKVKVSGVMNYRKGVFDGATFKGTYNLTEIEPTIGSKAKYVEKFEEEGVIIVKNDENESFIRIKGSVKENDGANKSTETVDEKTTYNYDSSLINYVTATSYENILVTIKNYATSGVCYIDGNNMNIIYSTKASQSVVNITCDKKRYNKIVITTETADSKMEITLTVCDEADINAPSDKKDYDGYVEEESEEDV